MKWPGYVLALTIFTVSSFSMPVFVWAQESILTPTIADATVSGVATESAEVATPAANVIVQQVTEKKPDVTEQGGVIAGQLEQFVINQVDDSMKPTNFIQYLIRKAVLAGMPANTIVLVILFPLVAALIAAGRHLIGLRGFGIFTPAVLSVAFVATGIVTGILLFLIILAVATLAKNISKKAKLQYLPRMALLFWFVCIGVLGVILVAPILDLQNLMTLSIFPILILILLAENFIEVQIGKSQREATELTVETIILALISSLVLSLEMVQKFALMNPELLLLGVGLFDVFMGRYVGLRLTEYRKFKKLLN
jgi:hypothetical protein